MNEDENLWRNLLYTIVSVILVFVIVGVLCKCDGLDKKPTHTSTNIDSILNTNDSIKITINYIDSVKHEEVEKVLKLDNDSTIELFKQLVRE